LARDEILFTIAITMNSKFLYIIILYNNQAMYLGAFDSEGIRRERRMVNGVRGYCYVGIMMTSLLG
jgi:hypothetical protein